MNPGKDKENKEVEWQTIQDLFDGEDQCNDQPFHAVLSNFRKDLESHPYVQSRRKYDVGESSRWPRIIRRLSIPAAGVAAAGILIALVLLSSPGLTWAQVARKFAEVEFMYASIYNKQDGLSAPEHIELWAGKGCKVRIRMGDQLIFAEKGRVLAAFDLKTRKQTEPDQMAVAFVELIGSEETFSLETVMRSLSGGRIPERKPVLNANALISEDLAVFDLDFKESNSLQWCRFWTLKKSGLPVRIRMWDPYDAASVDVFIDYSKPQSETFFDPRAFASALASVKTDQLNLAYLYLKDPGGKVYAPGVKDEHTAMSVVTTTIEGDPFSLAHHRHKNVLLYFWDEDTEDRDWEWLAKLDKKYGPHEDFEIITVATEKDKAKVVRLAESKQISYPILHEPGKGVYNSLARALGLKHSDQAYLIADGKAHWVDRAQERMIDLVCNGLNCENHMSLTRFTTMRETTKGQMLDLCGKPHKTETTDSKELWYYMFTSADGQSKRTVTIRFDEQGKYTGYASAGRLIEPSSVSVEISKQFWEENVEAVFGRENMPESNSDHHVEISISTGRGGYIIGGGHPRTDIIPGKTYDREVPAGVYSIKVRLMNHNRTYTQMKDTEILEALDVGKSENVNIYFGDSGPPRITRAAYAAGKTDNAAKGREHLLKKPDYKKMLEDAVAEQDKYDDPKYLPWQLHLKEIAARYEVKRLPEKMELMPKPTEESYALKMFPKDLPGHPGYCAVSIEGDLKSQFGSHPLGPGVMRWPDETPSVQMNHDLVYRDDISTKAKYTFILEQMGYKLKKVTEDRKVFVATYDGRELPDPEKVSAPNPGGWGWFTAGQLIDSLTRVSNPDMKAAGPVFIDQTGLPGQPDPGQERKDIAITMEMPSFTTQSFETLRPWFEDTFGISFTEERRPVEILVVRKNR